jgi:hypothetical protein
VRAGVAGACLLTRRLVGSTWTRRIVVVVIVLMVRVLMSGRRLRACRSRRWWLLS